MNAPFRPDVEFCPPQGHARPLLPSWLIPATMAAIGFLIGVIATEITTPQIQCAAYQIAEVQ